MPRLNFTIKTLDALKPPLSKQSEEYWDSSTPGFGLRMSKLGRKVWVVRYRVRGTREMDRKTLGSYEALSLADARITAREYLGAASRGNNLNEERLQQMKAEQEQKLLEERLRKEEKTFGWLADQYIELHAKRNKRSWAEDKRILDREILTFWDSSTQGWSERPIKDITRLDVQDLLESTLRRTQQKNEKGIGGKGVHANRVFSLIRKIFNFGIERNWLERNPCEKVSRPLKHEESRDYVLKLDGIRSIWNALDQEILRDPRTEYSAAIFKLMLLTAQRGGEVRMMAWEELDLEQGSWTLPKTKTKNKHAHTVPLSAQAILIISEFLIDKGKSPWVFPNPKDKSKPMKSFQKAIQRVRSCTNVPYVGHDLRRTASSHMASIGIQPHIIKKILNHSERQDITHIYNRYSYPHEKREALQKWADYLFEHIKERSEINMISTQKSSIEEIKSGLN